MRRLVSQLSVPAVIVVLQALLSWHTLQQVRRGLGARNLEASYHALLTAKALLGAPFSEHWGLPIVTLGQANDKWIAWGATVPTGTGSYVYTSFPPAGFWAPAIVGFLRGGNVGLGSLVVLNGVLAMASGVLLYLLVVRAVRRMDRGLWIARGAGLVGALLYLFSAESLQSHGVVYWAQSLVQPLLLGLLLILERLLTLPEQANRRKLLVGLGALTAIACYTEWTAYVFALLTGAVILLVPRLRRWIGAAGVVLVSVAVVTAVVLAAHFILVLGPDAAAGAWKARFLARSGAGATMLDLQYGYALSFGGAIFTALVVTALAAFRPAATGRRDDVGWIIVLFSLTAVMENLVMRQHATQFTFDRLKLGIPLALITGLAIGRLSRRMLAAAAVVVCVGAVMGAEAQRTDASLYASWPQVDGANRSLVARTVRLVDLKCVTIGTNTGVRGYTNVLLNRGVHEVVTPLELAALAAKDESSCGTVYIQAVNAEIDLPQYQSITVTRSDGNTRVLTPK